MELWMIFVAIYGILKGIREPIKKKALEKTDVMSALFMYTFLGFLMSAPFAKDIFGLTAQAYGIIFLKSFVLFFAWISAFESMRRLSVSMYGVMNMSRVIFSSLLGILLLGEKATPIGILSLLMVATGVGLAGGKKSVKSENSTYKDILLVLISCLFNAMSGTIDKYIMSTQDITPAQLQFWFMLILSAMYFVYMLAKRQKIDFKGSIKNPYIYLMSLSLVFGDRLLFAANANEQSSVMVMTLLKQSSVLVTIAAGKIIYKEKNIIRKLICAAIIILGILIAVI